AIIGVAILLLHSAIDFNMTFGTYNFFLFLFLSIIWFLVQDKPWASRLFASLVVGIKDRVGKQVKQVATYSFVGVLGLSSLFAAYTSYAYQQAEQVYRGLQQGGELPVLLAQVEQAISYNSHDVRFR